MKLTLKRHVTPPNGPFPGRNFMTRDIVEYGEIVDMEALGHPLRKYYEISEGRGMSNQPIVGITIRDANGDDVSGLKSDMRQGNAKNGLDYLRTLIESFEG